LKCFFCISRPGPGAPAREGPQQTEECARQCGTGDPHKCGEVRRRRPPGSHRLLCERRQRTALMREQDPYVTGASQQTLSLGKQYIILRHHRGNICSSSALLVSQSTGRVSINPLKTEFIHNFIYKFSSYLTGNTLRLHYKAQPVNAVWGNSRCLL
jgi:hypothetical protein